MDRVGLADSNFTVPSFRRDNYRPAAAVRIGGVLLLGFLARLGFFALLGFLSAIFGSGFSAFHQRPRGPADVPAPISPKLYSEKLFFIVRECR